MDFDFEYIKLNKKIDIKAWERFEELADIDDKLWRIFWTICNDKEEIKRNQICRNFYFNRFVLSDLYEPMKKLTSKRTINTKDIEIIFSLYLKLIPECKCVECVGETYLERNVDIRESSKN